MRVPLIFLMLPLRLTKSITLLHKKTIFRGADKAELFNTGIPQPFTNGLHCLRRWVYVHCCDHCTPAASMSCWPHSLLKSVMLWALLHNQVDWLACVDLSMVILPYDLMLFRSAHELLKELDKVIVVAPKDLGNFTTCICSFWTKICCCVSDNLVGWTIEENPILEQKLFSLCPKLSTEE